MVIRIGRSMVRNACAGVMQRVTSMPAAASSPASKMLSSPVAAASTAAINKLQANPALSWRGRSTSRSLMSRKSRLFCSLLTKPGRASINRLSPASIRMLPRPPLMRWPLRETASTTAP